MSSVVFPNTAAVDNTIPTNGNTVPITGNQALTNIYEMFAYSALLYENIHNSDSINFGGVTGTLSTCRVTNVISSIDGSLFLQIVGYVPLRKDYASFPNGGKLWKQVLERLPNQGGASGFNL